MIDLDKLQKEVYSNKLKKGFNIDNVPLQFCFIQSEITEAFQAWSRKQGNIGEELADVAIYLLGLAEIVGISLSEEIISKFEIAKKREYVMVNGALIKK